MSFEFSQKQAALVIAHPGHELRVYQWLRINQPYCFVLTDGSGHTGKSRLPSTTKILEETGAKAGCIFGQLTDREIYVAMIEGKINLFTELAEQLANELINKKIECVVGDALEGYNPAHDLCRYLINAAVMQANRYAKAPIVNLEVLLTGTSDKPLDQTEDDTWLYLDEESCDQKLRAVRSYVEIASDVDDILAQQGMDAIQIEHLRPVNQCLSCEDPAKIPYYEVHGEKQVNAGHYERVLRFSEHVRPIEQALWNWSRTALAGRLSA